MKDFSEIEEKLEEHRLLAIQLKAIKEKEAAMRRELCDILLKGKKVGTHNFNIAGMKVKAVKSVSYRLDKDIDFSALSEDERDLIRLKPELKLADYKGATFDTSRLDDHIVVAPSMPTLTIELAPEV